MTSQVPERFMIDGKPHWLHADPLYRLLASRRTRIVAPDGKTTACHRQYIGTWDIADGMLRLVTLCTYGADELPISDDMRAWFLKLVPATGFPASATWFSGSLQIPIGPQLVRGFHGWSSWYTRLRVITIRKGRVVRDREVDTLSILVWRLRRQPDLMEGLDPEDSVCDPRAWITEEDYAPVRGDWWPPGARIDAA